MIKIVALNSKYVHTLLSPYYLKENCEYKDKIHIVQSNINQSIEDIYALAIKDNPKLIALPCYIFNINCVLELSKLIKKRNPHIIIVYGGPEASFEYDDLLEIADIVITGEGEFAFNQMVCDLEKSNYLLESKKVYNGKKMNFADLKSPYSDDYFHDVEGKIAYFEASRGCPYSCAYCMSGNDGLRCFSLERTFVELEKFKGKNIRVLKFVDRTFNANKSFAKEIMKFLIKNSSEYSFGFHFEIAADILDDEFIEIVNTSPKGLFQFEVGVQSFNEKTLSAVVRKTNLNKLTDNLQKLTNTTKSHIHTDLIAGLPYEDYQSFVNGFNKLYSIKSDMLQLGFLKVLKGSALKNMLDDGYEYSKTPPYEIISTPYISKNELNLLKFAEEGCDKYYNSGLFKNTLDFFVKNPYDFYLDVGKLIYGKKLSLFERIQILYDYLCENNDCKIVKGIMTYDYISTNNSRILPECLKFNYDKNFAKLLRDLNIDKKRYFSVKVDVNPNGFEKGNYLLYVDYSCGYKVNYINLDEVKIADEN